MQKSEDRLTTLWRMLINYGLNAQTGHLALDRMRVSFHYDITTGSDTSSAAELLEEHIYVSHIASVDYSLTKRSLVMKLGDGLTLETSDGANFYFNGHKTQVRFLKIFK